MIKLLAVRLLLAEKNPLENFAREFQGRDARLQPGYLLTGLLILMLILLAVWLLSRVLERFDGRRPVDSSGMLFLSLCRAHGLRWWEWWLLFRVARAEQLDEPARLFLEPQRLDPGNLPSALQPKSEAVASLRQRLFGKLAEVLSDKA